MKKILLISMFVFAFLKINATHFSSELIFKLQDHSWFTTNIDNHFLGNPVTKLHINQIEPGRHFLTVYRFDRFHSPYAAPLVIFNGFIDIPAQSKVYAMIDSYYQFRINNIIALFPVPACIPPPIQQPLYIGMNESDFNQLKYSVERLSFESSRIQVIRQALNANQVSTRQVSELMRLLTFESTKLELAKFAYLKTIDKQNYYLINNEFTFESSIDELNNFISHG